ncbi:hypothetical protein Tco_0603609 [Tanacetum coccineum]
MLVINLSMLYVYEPQFLMVDITRGCAEVAINWAVKYGRVIRLSQVYEAKKAVPLDIRYSKKLQHDQKWKKMKLFQDMQLIQKLRDDQKRMKKVFEVMSGSYERKSNQERDLR